MSAPVPTGSIITYQSSDWYSGYFKSASNTISKVAQLLSQQGIKLTSGEVTNISIISEIDKYLGGPATFSVEITVQVIGGLGYNSPNDVGLIINNAAFQATGHLPGTWSVPTVSLPNTISVGGIVDAVKGLFTGKQTTGQPAMKPSNGFSLASITSKGILYLALGLLGFVAALALIGYSGALRSE